MSKREREKMKLYLEQLTTIKRALQTLYLMSADINALDLNADEQITFSNCDDAVETLLNTIYVYCEK